MAKDRRKIEKKRRKEAAKAKQARTYAAAKKREAERPKVTVDPTGGDAVLVKRVCEAAERVPLEESRGCPADIAAFLARLRRDGPEETCKHIRIQAAMNCDHHREVTDAPAIQFNAAAAYVGQCILDALPEGYHRKLLPNYYFYPRFTPTGAVVRFGFLNRVKRDTGWGHYSRHKPTVRINGADWIVCFSEHAIERVVERSNFDERTTYAHYMNCANYFDACINFEPVAMATGEPAIRLFMTDGLYGNTARYEEYLQAIAGIEDVNQLPFAPAYVLGYCPVDCKGRFAKAITMLYPGYEGTPEDTLVQTSRLSWADRKRLLDMAEDNKTVRVISEGRHEAIRWYHSNGVPQVVSLRKDLFRWGTYSQ